ncbi:MAG: peptidylprolyl isomerase, partial [Deltaproteobacteria bacterium]|nr:peptidylprolyl isomerase [Deltaproteobacteria bacterium]
KPVVEKLAVVNGVVIAKVDFDRKLHQVKQHMLRQGQEISDDRLAKIKTDVLETMINEELLFQESRKKGIKVEPEAIAADLKRIKKGFATDADFKKFIAESGLTEAELQSDIERGHVINKLIDDQIAALVVIPDQEIKTFYDTHPNSFKKPEQVRASHILIKIDSKAEPSVKDEKKAELQKIQKRLKGGEDFAVLAKEFSECPSNIKGGDLGYFGRGNMVKPFEDVAFALKTGEVSDIVETRFGYHLIKVVDKKPESVVGYEDVKDNIGQYLKKEKTGKELKGYIDKLRKKAVVEKFTS